MTQVMASGVQFQVRLFLKNEEWGAGVLAENSGRLAAGSRVLLSGASTAGTGMESRLTDIPAEVSDTEAVLYPLAAQIVEAVRATGVALGDSLPIFGSGVRARLAAVCAGIRGIVPVMIAAAPGAASRENKAAVVVEAGAALEPAACKSVRKGGVVALATAPQAPAQDFHFYLNLQQTRVTVRGIPCDMPSFAAGSGEALRAVRTLLSRGEAPPAISHKSGRGSLAECLMSWND